MVTICSPHFTWLANPPLSATVVFEESFVLALVDCPSFWLHLEKIKIKLIRKMRKTKGNFFIIIFLKVKTKKY
jgi:hypothetical protein